MGGKSSSTKQTTNQVSNQTSTPTITNGALSGGLNDYLSQLNNFASNTNASSLVAGPSALQQQAFGNAAGLTTSPLFGQASEMATQAGNAGANTATGTSLLTNLQSYMNPYTSNVTDAYTADFDNNAGQVRAAQAAQAAANGAFGGSRYGIQEAQTEGELSRARASGLAGILQQGFNTAAGLSAQDAQLAQQNNQFNAGQNDAALQRQLASASLLGSLGGQQNADQRANVALQAELGGTQRDIAQSQATSQLSLLQALGSLYGYNPALFTGQTTSGTSSGTSTGTTKENPGLLGSIGQGAQAVGSLASLFSDVRLKDDISLISTRSDGLGVYDYRYVWSPDRHTGLMAQEVASVYPEAVSDFGGFLAVNYAEVPSV